MFILVFTHYLGAQTSKTNSIDSLKISSSLEEVSDTVPDIDFFGTDTPLKISLKYDISSFVRNKLEAEYLDAELLINYDNFAPIIKKIRIKARGNFRRGECAFPPIFLNFKTDSITNTELAGMQKIKIVTNCSPSEKSENYIFKEYLAYKLYNILSDNSFRVRLLDITFIDTGKKKKNYQQHGFIIEPVELVAKRTNSVLVNAIFVKGPNIVSEDADRVALFQYMIGNTDWRFKGGHNMKYMKSLDVVTDKVIPVPYDFDFSGFVNTSYSAPQEWTNGISDVRQREYLGYCRDDEEDYLKTISLFNEKKEKIEETIANYNFLAEKDKKILGDFVHGFYKAISQPQKFIPTLKRECRNDEF